MFKNIVLSHVLLFSMIAFSGNARNNHTIMQKLYEYEIVKFGSFKLRSGAESSVYVDMRNATASIDLLNMIAKALRDAAGTIDYDRICGVPYGAVPIATTIALQTQEPLITVRKGIKEYGTQKMIEGIYNKGEKILLVEDVITTGSSILETVATLENHGLVVEDIVVFLDREQGGVQRLQELGYAVHVVMTLSDVLAYKADQCFKPEYLRMSYAMRAHMCSNGVAKKLFAIMEAKQTNLAVAADVTSMQQLITLVQAVGPYICMLKLHVDILEDFDSTTISTLQNLAQDYNFILVEDRKFADTGNTVQEQYTGGLYCIADWADLVTVHAVAGSGMIDHMKQMVNTDTRGAIMLAQMSTTETLARGHYTDYSIAIGNQHADFIVGFITRTLLDLNPAHIRFTPGISFKVGVLGDQNYITPEQAILECGSDVLIVGRSIYMDNNPEHIAQEYRRAGWNAYQKRIGNHSEEMVYKNQIVD